MNQIMQDSFARFNGVAAFLFPSLLNYAYCSHDRRLKRNVATFRKYYIDLLDKRRAEPNFKNGSDTDLTSMLLRDDIYGAPGME